MPLTNARKTVAAAIGTILTWAGVAYVPDGHVDRPEWYALAVALATVAGVYGVSNAPKPAAVAVGLPAEPVAVTHGEPPIPPVFAAPSDAATAASDLGLLPGSGAPA